MTTIKFGVLHVHLGTNVELWEKFGDHHCNILLIKIFNCFLFPVHKWHCVNAGPLTFPFTLSSGTLDYR